MDKSLRNTLRNVVTQCRRLLEEAVAELLEGQFGIYTTGKIESVDRMKHLSADDLEYREQLLIHLQHIQAAGFKTKDAVEQLVREVAFTHLNRFCAYKMMETRGLIRKAVSDGLKSQGFLFYLADNSAEETLYTEGKQDVAYRHFLEWLGSTLSEEIGVLFSPHDPANRLLPPQRIIDSVLNFINSEELKDIWVEDETIGWVYQYFTPKELRDKARKESQAPRNSYELAFRNQFYTPSYVVQFLTDNTLGRIWYEMRQGETALIENCKYLVRRPHEVFLALGKEVPVQEEQADDLSQEELLKQPVYILHRPKKDPREIKIIDPACGSGHFLLYCFSLLLIIYEEAYDDPDLSAVLQQYYPDREEYRKAVPGLILAHNLHGIDIDIRATQIAALALWLRAQRAYQEMGIKKNRPKITKSNIVCAEPMPGEKELLDEFVAELQPTVLGQLVQVVFEKMKLAGEAGLLLIIEEKIKNIVGEAKQQWQAGFKPKQLSILPEYERQNSEQLNIFNITDITNEDFWNQAEILVIKALHDYANRPIGNHRLLRQLFVDDIVQGFAFIDICQKRFDVVLMNPPFGLPSEEIKNKLEPSFLAEAIPKNLAWAFVELGKHLSIKEGMVGAIVDRTIFQKVSYEGFRKNIVFQVDFQNFLDLGIGVLDDANVFASCFTFGNRSSNQPALLADLRQLKSDEKMDAALLLNSFIINGYLNENYYYRYLNELTIIPFYSFAYWLDKHTIQSTFNAKKFEDSGIQIRVGLQCNDVFRFLRLIWEVPPSEIGKLKNWINLYNGGRYSLFWIQNLQLVNWQNSGFEIKNKIIEKGESPSRYVRSESLYFLSCIAGGERGEYFDVHCLPQNMIFSNESRAFFIENKADIIPLLGYLNTLFAQNLVNAFCGQHKGSEYLKNLPLPSFIQDNFYKLTTLTISAIKLKMKASSFDEVSLEFNSIFQTSNLATQEKSLFIIHKSICNYFEISDNALIQIINSLRKIIEESVGTRVLNKFEYSGWNETPPPID